MQSSMVMASGLLEELLNRYRKIQTMEGVFHQRTYFRDIDVTKTYKGHFYLKRPDMMKWIYTESSTDEIYIKGREIVLFQPAEKQAFVTDIAKMGLKNSPLMLLMNLDSLKEDFNVIEKKDSILLRPLNNMAIQEIRLFVDNTEGFIKGFVITDTRGNSSEIELGSIKYNPKLPQNLFDFKPPDDVTIIRQ